MFKPEDLAVWLLTDLAANTAAMEDLIESGDVKIVAMRDTDEFGLVRGHNELVPRFGRDPSLPILAAVRA